MAEATEPNNTASVPADAQAIEESLAPVGVVKSTAQGRIRLQLRKEYRTPDAMARIRTQLEKDPRVKEVTINERTGSVTVKYAAEHHGHGLLWQAVQETELIGEAAFDLPEDEEEEQEERGAKPQGTYGKLDQQVSDLIYRFDLAVFRKTRGKIHLRGRALPLGIAGLGVAQIAIFGISLETLPGPLLLWLAHDIHHRVGKEPPMTLTDQPAAPSSTEAETSGLAAPAAA